MIKRIKIVAFLYHYILYTANLILVPHNIYYLKMVLMRAVEYNISHQSQENFPHSGHIFESFHPFSLK